MTHAGPGSGDRGRSVPVTDGGSTGTGLGGDGGGVERYPLDRLYEEVAFVAYYFGWSRTDVLALPHWERRRWCEEISRINARANAGADDGRAAGVSLLDVDAGLGAGTGTGPGAGVDAGPGARVR